MIAGTSSDRRLVIRPRAPFRLELTAWALRRCSHNGIDRWDGDTYRRVVSIDGGPVAIAVRQQGAVDAPRLSVILSGRALGREAEPVVRAELTRLLGLSVDVSAFAALAAEDPLLAPLTARMRGLNPPRFPTVFEGVVNAIACQQLSLAVGVHLLNRLTGEHGQPVAGDPHSPHARWHP
jgi:DNA-3-methyladenine glycosylase II